MKMQSHHRIIYSKFDLRISYPPPYLIEISHYKDTITELIRRSVEMFEWGKAFSNTNVNEKLAIFNRIILNILNNFIPHETIVCSDRGPPCFNDKIRLLIKDKRQLTNIFVKIVTMLIGNIV